MKRLLILHLVLNMAFSADAQTSLAGDYYLQGVHEVASAFRLKPDSTFEFFFSYGALDRTGTGRWSVAGGRIVFQSRPWPGSDFRLLGTDTEVPDGNGGGTGNGSGSGNSKSASQKTDNKKAPPVIIVKVEEKNTMILPFIDCYLKKGNEAVEGKMRQDGMAVFPAEKYASGLPDSLILQFRFCPERYSRFAITDPKITLYRFSIETWMPEYFFTGFSLLPLADGSALEGGHPLLEGQAFTWVREKEQ
ncbi:hypothetical protein [Flavihumibacter petaseus]|uniref:Uncharacterized protein n=1 Tax=Flavihumibacter petaseus NBRC 106054 TaxID=1220578 RepID=A0A0E9N0Y3_9BACT|nr:hypothetical protein [Flavihumibacter petaseus]GAO43494.1 hypothetical protein FPE01S_02_05990 [Flavihumibacter petaseus NBRC 106054]